MIWLVIVILGVIGLGYALKLGLAVWGLGLAPDATPSRCDMAIVPPDQGGVDSTFADLGFTPAASVVITNPRAADAYVLFWVHPDGTVARTWPPNDAELPLAAPRTVSTAFGHGLLATSTVASSDLLAWSIELCEPKASPADLVAAHRAAVAALEARGLTPVPIDADRAVDLFLREWRDEVTLLSRLNRGERLALAQRTSRARRRTLDDLHDLDARLTDAGFGEPA